MDSGGVDAAKEKGKVSLMMKRNTECRDREMAEERDNQRFSADKGILPVGWEQGKLKLESAYTVDFSCVWTKQRDAVCWQQVAVQRLHSGSPQNCFTII